MKIRLNFASLAAVAVMALSGATVASAQSTLETVKDRGHLRCQVGPPSPGYYNLDSNGDWEALMYRFARLLRPLFSATLILRH